MIEKWDVSCSKQIPQISNSLVIIREEREEGRKEGNKPAREWKVGRKSSRGFSLYNNVWKFTLKLETSVGLKLLRDTVEFQQCYWVIARADLHEKVDSSEYDLTQTIKSSYAAYYGPSSQNNSLTRWIFPWYFLWFVEVSCLCEFPPAVFHIVSKFSLFHNKYHIVYVHLRSSSDSIMKYGYRKHHFRIKYTEGRSW